MLQTPLEQRPAATAAAMGPLDGPVVDLAVVGTLLRRRWGLIAAILALFLAAAGVYVGLAPKTWRATTRVLLDSRDRQPVGAEVGKPPAAREAGWTELRAELVKSQDNLSAVVAREHLADDPEFLGAGTADLGPEARAARAVRTLADLVVVERPKDNNLVDVSVIARSRETAARLSRSVADAFVAGLARAEVDQIEQASALLSRQVESMRQKMAAAEARVEDYKRNNGITGNRNNPADEETLRRLDENLAAAHKKAQETRERWEKLKQILKSGDLQSLDGVGSPALSRLGIESAMAAKRRAEIERDYGPLHPRARAAAAEMDRDRSLALDQVKSLTASAEADHQTARAAEDEIRKSRDRARARLADTGPAPVALQELENEARTRRELYKSFAARLEETNLRKSTGASDATIVSPALVPLRPHAPNLAIVFGLAALAGLGAGVSAALLRGRRDLAEIHAARARIAEAATVVPPAVVDPIVPPPEAHVAEPADPPPPDAPVEPEFVVAPLVQAAAPRLEPAAAEPPPPEPMPTRRPANPVCVRLGLTPERIARLGGLGDPPAEPVDAFVETADGRTDLAGLAALRRLADELASGDEPRIALYFLADGVPTSVAAALVHGLARARAGRGARVLVIDLSDETAAFDVAFERALPVARSRRRRVESGFDLRADDHGVAFARPAEEAAAADPSRDAGRLVDFVATAARDHDAVLIHLGASPPAGLLFDAAEIADHVTLVIDEKDLSGRRLPAEIEVLRGLLPRLDGIVVLEVADPTARDDDRRRHRRA